MRRHHRLLLLAGALASLGAVAVVAATGPDLIAGDIHSTRWWATDEVETAYSFGRTACNLGDETVAWAATPNHNHPLSAAGLFRLSADGEIEHIGYHWMFHHFCALQQGICGACEGGGGCQSVLHPLCSNPNTASRHGSQGGLGPKWQVNPHTVEFVLPWAQGEGTGGSFRRRTRVKNVDLDPALNPGARYFVEMQYLAKDDAAAGHQNNNASYREVLVAPATYALTFADVVRRERPAILAWADNDPLVAVAVVQIDADGERDPETGLFDDGRFLVAHKATDRGDGTWRYEYAVWNQNSHRAARAFAVPVSPGVTITDIGFHDIDYHSGDGIGDVNFDGTDWPATVADGAIRWETETIDENENANALRWGTLYNFRFTADAPPAPVNARLAMFRAGDPGFVPVPVSGPHACRGDLDGDGDVGFEDLLGVLSAWGPCPPPPGCPADLDASGDVGFADLLVVLGRWGPCD